MSDTRFGTGREFEGRIVYLEQNARYLEQTVRSIREDIFTLFRETALSQNAFYDFFWKMQAGVDFDVACIQRFIPIRIYSADLFEPFNPEYLRDERQRHLLSAIEGFLSAFGFGAIFHLPDEEGSWVRRLGAATRQFISGKEFQRHIADAENAAKTVLLDKPIAEVSLTQAQAFAKYMESIDKFDDVSVQSGPIFLAKRTTPEGRRQLIYRSLSARALKILEEDQETYRQTDKAFELLQGDGAEPIELTDELRARITTVAMNAPAEKDDDKR